VGKEGRMMQSTSSKIIGGIILLIQVFDVILHAATDQLEFLRVTSNIIILIWLTVLFLVNVRIKPIASFGTTGLYLFLNLLFLAQAGFTNPEQDDAPRTMLFILVALTVLLSMILTIKHQRSEHI
jgi:hypothetical protein